MDNPYMPILAWHFLPADRHLAYGERKLVTLGETISVTPTPVMCEHGLHWSENVLDAVRYASGPIACLVHATGIIVLGHDKGCSTERTVVAWIDATAILHTFACEVAEQALYRERDAGREPDERSWAAITAKRVWLRGEIGNEILMEARVTARTVAYQADLKPESAIKAASAAVAAASVEPLAAVKYVVDKAAWAAALDGTECKGLDKTLLMASRKAAVAAALAEYNRMLTTVLTTALGEPHA